MKISPQSSISPFRESFWIKLAFILPILYWIYLFFTANPVIVFDSIGYENLGKLLAEDGWWEYFQGGGPRREPFYPWLISVSMVIGKSLNVSYISILKIIQFGILFFTQLLTLNLLRRLKIRSGIIVATILYLGFSPAIVTSALSVYSEVATYPFVVAVILFSYQLWEAFKKQKGFKELLTSSFLMALCLFILTMTKAVFEIVAPMYLFLLFIVLWKKNKFNFLKVFLVIGLSFLVFQGGVTSYKMLNKKGNGNYAITNRGSWALYGNTARRVAPMEAKRILAAFSYVPGQGVCYRFLPNEECVYWSFLESDILGRDKSSWLSKSGIDDDEKSLVLLNESLNLVIQNPFQYTLFYILEAGKMFFWESTKGAYVEYPEMLSNLFAISWIKDGLRLLMSLVTFGVFLHLFWLVLKRDDLDEGRYLLLVSFLGMVMAHCLIYSFFFILPRYALPLAPIYLIMMAVSLNIRNNMEGRR